MFEEELVLVLSNGTEVWHMPGCMGGVPDRIILCKEGESVVLSQEDAWSLAKYIYNTFDRSISEERKVHRRLCREMQDMLTKFIEDNEI